METREPRPLPDALTWDLHELAQAIQRRLRSSFGADGFVYDVAALAGDLVACGSAAVLMTDRGRTIAVAHSDATAADLHAVQLADGDGPSLAALRTNAFVEVADTLSDERWRVFSEKAAGSAVLAVAAVPMVVERCVVGSVTLYSRRSRELSAQLRACLDLLADQAGHGWHSLVRQRELEDANEHLMKALTSRPVIDQAIGVLMAESSCPASAAFDMLRRHSSNNNRKLRDVAAEIVTRASGAPPETPHGFVFRDGTSAGSVPACSSAGHLMVTATDSPRGMRLAGEADATELTTLRDALGELFVRPPAPGDDLVVDVADLEFIDVACLRLLVRGADLAHERGSRLVLRSPSASLLSLLESTWSAAPMHLDVEDCP